MRQIFIFILVINFLSSAYSQEKQIPFFPEGNVVIIDKAYAKKASLFTTYDDFIEARLFEISNDEYAVEIYYKKNGEIFKDRKVLNQVQKNGYISSLKQEVVKETQGIAQKDSVGELQILDQSGRSLLLVNSTIVGLGFYGYALPFTLKTESNKVFVALYMLSSGASFFIPYSGTKDKSVSMAQTSMTFYGQTRGILHGTLLATALTDEVNYDDNNWEEKSNSRESKIFGLGVLGSVAEGFLGYKLADRWDYDPGSASMLQMWGDVGALEGLLISGMFDLYNYNNSNDVISAVLLSSAAGMVVGKQFGDTRNYTVGDAIFYRASIGLGAMIPPLIVYYFEPKNWNTADNIYTTAAFVGSIGGTYLGWKLLKDVDFTVGQGLMISFSGIAGCLSGLGLGYLVSPDDTNGKFMLTLGAIGGITGYGLTYRFYKNVAQKSIGKVDFDVRFNPASLAMKHYLPQINSPFYYNELACLRIRF